jgi:RNA polymerase sigma factor (sigma-70 family)
MQSLSIGGNPAVRAACDAGDFDGAAAAALQELGAEILGFLVGTVGDYDEASDAFALFSEKLWQSLRQFEWECSLRTWCYRLARNVVIDLQRGAGAGKHHVEFSKAPEVFEMAARVRTTTMSALRTGKRTALERLRDELPEEDRALLVLRVDRDLEWREVALVLTSEGGTGLPDDVALARESARLRKRFQLVIKRLRAMAGERGLR